jgi:hypothetical protein
MIPDIPMKKSILLLSTLLLTVFLSHSLNAQDTLPDFSVRSVGSNRIIISWTNLAYPSAKQISIQRSADSLKGYKTIVTVPDPTTVQNGYVDSKAPAGNMFYRLFIVLNGARYFFSTIKRPFTDSLQISREQGKIQNPFGIEVNKPGKFNDSITNGIGVNKIKPDIFIPSNFVYTAKDGNVHLNFPHADTMSYWVKFFDEKDQYLFEIKNIKEPSLIVDKTNFYHAGWFKFELYVNEKLKEKNKFYLAKEF